MKSKRKIALLCAIVLCVSMLLSYSSLSVEATNSQNPVENTAEQKKYIKWMTFDVPYAALDKAMRIDIKSHNTDRPLNWIEILAYLSAKYGGNWKKYKAKDMDALVQKLKSGCSMSDLTANMKYYKFYHEAYDAVLHSFLGYRNTM